MKRFILLLTILALLAISAQAQTPAAPAAPATTATTTPPVPGTKIGILDFRTALMDSAPGKAAQEQYMKEIEPARVRYETVQKEFADLQTKLQNAKTDAERSAINRDIDGKNLEVQRAQQDAQRLSDDLQERLLPPVAALVNKMVDEYAKENNLAVVIDPLTDPSNVVFANKAADITAEIMRRMNAAYEKDPKIVVPAANVPASPEKTQ